MPYHPDKYCREAMSYDPCHQIREISVLNDLIDPSAQNGFLMALNGTFEHIISVSAILDNALLHRLPLAMIFINLKMLSDRCHIAILMIS